MRTIRLKPRICECCGSYNQEKVWESNSIVTRAKSKWKFPYHISICKNCGFTFSSPAPVEEDLLEYHSEGLTGYKGISLPYTIEKRLPIIEKYAKNGGKFAEIGGDLPEKFHNYCSKFFDTILSVEIAEDTLGDYNNLYDLEENSFDMIAHYDVLEHIGDIKKFLQACFKALRLGGYMVCEMPDLRLYPKNLLLLEFEHVNHFSIQTLSKICGHTGFRLVETGHKCSRPYGMLAVFKKLDAPIEINYNEEIEILDAKACIEGGISQVEELNNYINDLRKKLIRLSEKSKIVTIWAVNDILRRLLDNFKLPEGCIVVDSDPRRENDLNDIGVKVGTPYDNVEHIKNSDFLIISAARYQNSICEWIEKNFDKKFSDNALIVLGDAGKETTLT